MESSTYTPSFYSNQNILGYVGNAQQQAESISTNKYAAKSSVNSYGSTWCFVSSRSSNNRNDNRAAVFAIGTVAAVVGAFLLGKFLSQREDAFAQLNSIHDFKKNTFKPCKKELEKKGVLSNQDFERIKNIRSAHASIFKHRLQNANLNIALAVSAVAFGAFAIIGALAASHALMLIAVGGLVTSAVLTAFKAGYAHFSRTERFQAEEICRLAPKVLQMTPVVYEF